MNQSVDAHALSVTASFRVSVHRDIAALTQWPRSGVKGIASCHAFQTVEFLQTWLDTYGRATDAEPYFVSVRELDNSLLLLLPLTITRRGAVRELSFMDATACDYNAPVLFPTHRTWTRNSAAALWADVTAALPNFDLILLEKLPAKVGDLTNPLHLLATSDNPESCHGTDLSGSWEVVEGTLKNLRTIRKQTRGLERIAPLHLKLGSTPEDRGPLIATMLAQKQRRFEETRVPGFDKHPEKAAFLEQGSRRLADNGGLRFYGLYLGEEILATAWGIMHAETYYWLVISSAADKWARSSPGRVLHRLLLQTLHAEGCRYVDNGIGDEQWKLDNLNRTVPLRMHVEAVTWRGHARLVRRRILERVRGSHLWQRLRPYKWVVLRNLGYRVRTQTPDVEKGEN